MTTTEHLESARRYFGSNAPADVSHARFALVKYGIEDIVRLCTALRNALARAEAAEAKLAWELETVEIAEKGGR